jgi:hypothetical protein
MSSHSALEHKTHTEFTKAPKQLSGKIPSFAFFVCFVVKWSFLFYLSFRKHLSIEQKSNSLNSERKSLSYLTLLTETALAFKKWNNLTFQFRPSRSLRKIRRSRLNSSRENQAPMGCIGLSGPR